MYSKYILSLYAVTFFFLHLCDTGVAGFICFDVAEWKKKSSICFQCSFNVFVTTSKKRKRKKKRKLKSDSKLKLVICRCTFNTFKSSSQN